MGRTVLLGLHGKRVLVAGLTSKFESRGYSVDLARTPEEMLGYAKEKLYDRYLMDLNVGESNSPDATPAINVYDVVKERVESGEAKFLGISGNSDAVKAVRGRGIPAFGNLLEGNLDDFLE